MALGTVYAVAGAKGGVGKTTTSLNLGAALATPDRAVVVVELDLAMANVADFLALDVDPESDTTLHDVLAGDAAVPEAVYEADDGFAVVPSGTALDGFAAVDIERVGDVLATLREQYDVVLLDTGAGLSHETLLPLALAAETVLVTSPRVASVRDAEKTKQLTERVGGTVAGAVFVRSGTGSSPPVDRIADFLDVPLLGHVPEDDAVPASQDAGRPVVTHTPDSPAADAYRSIADQLGSRDTPDPDETQVASNAIRAREETAKHRSGFVFPEGNAAEDGKSQEGEASAVRDTATGELSASDKPSPDGVDGVDERSSADTDSEHSSDDSDGEHSNDDVVSDDRAVAPSLAATGNRSDAPDSLGSKETAQSTAYTDDESSPIEQADDHDPSRRAAVTDDERTDVDDEKAGLRGRVGAVVSAVRRPF